MRTLTQHIDQDRDGQDPAAGAQGAEHQAYGDADGDSAKRSGHRRSSLARKPRCSPLSCPGHHWPAGTVALTWSMCCPHPAQVVRPQVLQVTARHMEILLRVVLVGSGAAVRALLG